MGESNSGRHTTSDIRRNEGSSLVEYVLSVTDSHFGKPVSKSQSQKVSQTSYLKMWQPMVCLTNLCVVVVDGSVYKRQDRLAACF